MDGSREGGSRFSASAMLVPLMLLTSSLVMAMAWLGHLRFKEELSLLAATSLAWLLVLPEYALNIKALRMGYGIYLAAQMAAFRLCAGVVWVALVVLQEFDPMAVFLSKNLCSRCGFDPLKSFQKP